MAWLGFWLILIVAILLDRTTDDDPTDSIPVEWTEEDAYRWDY